MKLTDFDSVAPQSFAKQVCAGFTVRTELARASMISVRIATANCRVERGFLATIQSRRPQCSQSTIGAEEIARGLLNNSRSLLLTLILTLHWRHYQSFMPTYLWSCHWLQTGRNRPNKITPRLPSEHSGMSMTTLAAIEGRDAWQSDRAAILFIRWLVWNGLQVWRFHCVFWG